MNTDTYTENIIIYGILYVNDLIIENVRCNMFYSKISPLENMAKITISGEVKINIDIFNDSPSIKFTHSGDYSQISIEGRFLGFTSVADEENELSIKIIELNKTYTLEPNKPTEYHTIFYLTKNSLFKSRKSATFHVQRGYYKGWDPQSKLWSDSERYEYKIDGLIYYVYPGFIADEQVLESNENVAHILIEQTIIECHIEETQEESESIKKKMFNQLAKFLFLLSFIEARQIDWYYSNQWGKSDGKLVLENQTYKTLEKNLLTGINTVRYSSKHLINLFANILKQYDLIDPSIKKRFDKLLNMYLIAFNVPTIEAKIIFSITCLDLIKNYSSKRHIKEDYFVDKLLKSCEDFEIEWLDLYPGLEINPKSGRKKTIILYSIRKDLVHEGIFSSDIKLILSELKKARCLTERFLLKILEIDWINSGLGKFK